MRMVYADDAYCICEFSKKSLNLTKLEFAIELLLLLEDL